MIPDREGCDVAALLEEIGRRVNRKGNDPPGGEPSGRADRIGAGVDGGRSRRPTFQRRRLIPGDIHTCACFQAAMAACPLVASQRKQVRRKFKKFSLFMVGRLAAIRRRR
jgi:hypothetical protein